MTAAHGGYGSQRVPLGGGAAVFERLCDAWAHDPELELIAAGAGPHPPAVADYRRLAPPAVEPSRLGTLAYASFCEDFGQATTELALQLEPDIVLTHDVSEGPDVARLAQAGIRVATIFHVDVVDIFHRLYLAGVIAPPRLTEFYRRLRSWPWPSLLKLVFEKQERVLSHGHLQIVPSPGAAELLRRCYPQQTSPIAVVGWGAPQLEWSDELVTREAAQLRASVGVPDDHHLLLTLSRLSPEKAQHRLLQAVALAEREGLIDPTIHVAIGGAPAFMQGQGHARRLRRLAAKLRTPVHFLGHVGGLQRAGWYRAADLFVVCSLHESYGLTTLEAMQQGCPVVAAQSIGTAATVTEQNGRLLPQGAEFPRRLWGEIALLLRPEGREERLRLGQGARETARQATFPRAAQEVRRALFELLRTRS